MRLFGFIALLLSSAPSFLMSQFTQSAMGSSSGYLSWGTLLKQKKSLSEQDAKRLQQEMST